MNKTNFFGALFCASIFTMSLFVGGMGAMFYNTLAFMVVVPGIAGAVLLSYPSDRIRFAFHVAYNSYTKKLKTPSEIILTLLDMSAHSREEGFFSLNKLSKVKNISFLERAVSLLTDHYKDQEIKEILMSEMQFFKIRRQKSEKLFRHMANLAPAFGIAGSVIGLTSMIGNIQDTEKILESIPVALVSTLYGIVLSYFFFSPIAENIYNKTQKELLLQRIIMAGIMAMRSERNSYRLETKLTSYLTPSDRSFIQNKLNKIRQRSIKVRKISNFN